MSSHQLADRHRQPCGEESNFMSDYELNDSDQWSEVEQNPGSDDEWDLVQPSGASSNGGDNAGRFLDVYGQTFGRPVAEGSAIAIRTVQTATNSNDRSNPGHAERNLHWTTILAERPAPGLTSQPTTDGRPSQTSSAEAESSKVETGEDESCADSGCEDLEGSNGSIAFPSDDEGTVGFDDQLSSTITLPARQETQPLMEPLQTWYNDLVNNFNLPPSVAERIVVLGDIHQVYAMAIYMALTGHPFDEAFQHLQSILLWDLRQIEELVDLQLANDFAHEYGRSWYNLMMTLEAFEGYWYKMDLKTMGDARAIVYDGWRWRGPVHAEFVRTNGVTWPDNVDGDEDEDEGENEDENQDENQNEDSMDDESAASSSAAYRPRADDDNATLRDDDYHPRAGYGNTPGTSAAYSARMDDDNATLTNDGYAIWADIDIASEAAYWDVNNRTADLGDARRVQGGTFLDPNGDDMNDE